MCKFVTISGGCFSGTGKGISSASIGLLLKMRGLKIQMLKFDPYINLSASTLSPYEHGNCVVLDDGKECDLDMTNYYAITQIDLSSKNICTSGQIYQELIQEEIDGKYLGKTVQMIPHLSQKVIDKVMDLSKDVDVVITEIGGTTGDVESSVFFEAFRQMKVNLGSENVVFIHVAPILWINTIKEFKTKPLQKSIVELRTMGIHPDILLCRTDREVPGKILDKIGNLTGIPRHAIFDAPDVESIYQVPIEFYDRHVDDLIADKLHLKRTGVRIHKYRDLVEKYVNSTTLPNVTIGVLGKYASCPDAYLSLKEAIIHAAIANNHKVNIKWIEAEDLEKKRDVSQFFEDVDGIIVPGGFDNRGVEGKIKGIKYCREKQIPLLGICLGLQCGVIEFARNVCGIKNATSEEFKKEDEDVTNVIHFVEGQENVKRKGGTLRLGAYECELAASSKAREIYKKKRISERHRHRYEVNPEFVSLYEKKGLKVSGTDVSSGLVEVMELEDHPYFVLVQFHPEFKSGLTSPHPLFVNLIRASVRDEVELELCDEAMEKVEETKE